jgi:hypothetical protein
MTTIDDIRDRVRRDLRDIDPGSERWEDAQLDRHIEHALGELSLSLPREASATIAVTPGSRTISVAGLDGLLEIEAVEYPVGDYPPLHVAFSHWDADVMLHLSTPPQEGDVRVRYLARHTIDSEGTTLPAALEDVLATGATAFAALEWANYAIDHLTTGGDRVAERYASWGRAAHTAFVQLLLQHARQRRLRGRRLFVPA